MLDDTVTRTALIVITAVFFITVITIAILYLLIRAGEKGARGAPHKGQMWLAGAIGIALPLLMLGYALLLSPSARLSPKQLHRQILLKEKQDR